MTERVQIGDATLYLGDCMAVLPTLAADSVDAVVTDPPYGIGIDTWDFCPPIQAYTRETCRVCTGFLSIFGQFPSLLDWMLAIQEQGGEYCEHIVWAKRMSTPSCRLARAHENILIFSVGAKRLFYVVRGPWEDVRIPMIMTDTCTVEAMDRYIKSLWNKVDQRESGIDAGLSRKRQYSRFDGLDHSDRSPREVNFSTVWSFLPPSKKSRNGNHDGHPTEKPVEIMARLTEMLAPDDGIVCDPFMGSGTTGVACAQTGRKFIGIEIDPGYFEIACQRIAAAYAQPRLPLADPDPAPPPPDKPRLF